MDVQGSNLSGPWAIYVCPVCGAGPYADAGQAQLHAAVRCEPDTWPWEPIVVVPRRSDLPLVAVIEELRQDGAANTFGTEYGQGWHEALDALLERLAPRMEGLRVIVESAGVLHDDSPLRDEGPA